MSQKIKTHTIFVTLDSHRSVIWERLYMMERLIYSCIKGHILPALAKSLNHEFCIARTAAFKSIRTSFQQLKWTAAFPLIWLIHEKSPKTVRMDIGNCSLHLFLFTSLLVIEGDRLYLLAWDERIYLRAPGNTVSYWHVLAKGLPEKIFFTHPWVFSVDKLFPQIQEGFLQQQSQKSTSARYKVPTRQKTSWKTLIWLGKKHVN